MATRNDDVRDRILQWRREHPGSTAADCLREKVASKSMIYRTYKEAAAAEADATEADPAERSERMTIVMTPAAKKALRHMCVDDDLTAAEWIERAILAAWERRKQ